MTKHVLYFSMAYSEVLVNLLDNQQELSFLPSPGPMTTPTQSTPTQTSLMAEPCVPLEVVLKAPLAYGIKIDQEKVTYLNRGVYVL